MKKLLPALAIGLSTYIAETSLAQQRFPVTTLNVGVHLIQAEVALRDEERAQGLMFREQLGANEGMVFRFPDNRPVCMWMKNTLVPLSVAFIDEAGKIINIEDMQPQTQDAHCAKRPARYAGNEPGMVPAEECKVRRENRRIAKIKTRPTKAGRVSCVLHDCLAKPGGDQASALIAADKRLL